MGDELALPNDYGYLDDPDHAHDSRWIHRPRMDWALAEARHSGDTPGGPGVPGDAGRSWPGARATPALHGGGAGAGGRRRAMTRCSPSSGWPRPGRCWACSTSPNAGSSCREGLGARAGGARRCMTRCRTARSTPHGGADRPAALCAGLADLRAEGRAKGKCRTGVTLAKQLIRNGFRFFVRGNERKVKVVFVAWPHVPRKIRTRAGCQDGGSSGRFLVEAAVCWSGLDWYFRPRWQPFASSTNHHLARVISPGRQLLSNQGSSGP